MDIISDVIIIGAGPAGLTAGLYTSRAGLRTMIVEKEIMGGKLMNRDLIENYPGYPAGILGPELGANMVRQVENYGAEILLSKVEQIEKLLESEELGKSDLITIAMSRFGMSKADLMKTRKTHIIEGIKTAITNLKTIDVIGKQASGKW